MMMNFACYFSFIQHSSKCNERNIHIQVSGCILCMHYEINKCSISFQFGDFCLSFTNFRNFRTESSAIQVLNAKYQVRKQLVVLNVCLLPTQLNDWLFMKIVICIVVHHALFKCMIHYMIQRHGSKMWIFRIQCFQQTQLKLGLEAALYRSATENAIWKTGWKPPICRKRHFRLVYEDWKFEH